MATPPELYQTLQLTPAGGQVSSSGDNTLITPSSGKLLRIYYLSYNNTTATVECYFTFAGVNFLRNKIIANSVIAKDFGDFRCVQGSVGGTLVLNLDTATPVNWSCMYVEI